MDDPPLTTTRPTSTHRTSSLSQHSLRPRPKAAARPTSSSSHDSFPSPSSTSHDNHSSSSLEPIHDFHAPPAHPPLHARSRRASMRSFVTVNREEGEGGGVELRPSTSPNGLISPTIPGEKSEPIHSGSGSPEDPYVVCFQNVDAGDPRQWGSLKKWSM